MLKGKRVTLRPHKKNDIKACLRWFNDPEITRYLVSYLPVTEVSEEKWFEKILGEESPIFAIEIKLNKRKKTIGNCGLHNINEKDKVAEFGIMIGEKSCWGKGYGFEVATLIINYGFNTLNLHKIESGAFAFNQRSVNMHKKIGFVEEGRKRKHIFIEGKYHDLIIFGLLKKEWQ